MRFGRVVLSFLIILAFSCSGERPQSGYQDFITSTDGAKEGGLVIGTGGSGTIVKSIAAINPDSEYQIDNNTGEANIQSADLTKYLPPVGNQGSQNSCVGWAVGYYLKTFQENKENNRTDTSEKSLAANICSPAFVYNFINIKDDNGSMPDDAFVVLNDFGCAPLDKMPYNDSDYNSWPSEDAFRTAASWRTTGSSSSKYYKLSINSSSDLNQIKQLLINEQPVVFGINIYQNYLDLSGTGSTLTVAQKSGQNKGAHAQLIVGFDDNKDTADGKGAFLVVNSWSTQWGDNGYYWISYKSMEPNSPYLADNAVTWVEDKINYQPDAQIEVKAAANNARTASPRIVLGNQTKEFLDFGFGGSYSVQSKAFPDSKMVFDITEWSSSISAGSQLEFKLSSGTVNYFAFLQPSKDRSVVASSTGSSSATVTVPNEGEDAGDDDTGDDDSGGTNTGGGGTLDDGMSVPCESCCSSAITNMASQMGYQMYSMFSWMPFIGDMMNTAAGMFFSQVLNNPQLTLDMIICAKGNDAMVQTMIKVVSANPQLLYKMQEIMRQSNKFTYHFMDLALINPSLAAFFFDVIHDDLYEAMTHPLVRSQEIRVQMGKLMVQYGKDEMQPNKPFARVFFNLGEAGNDTDGNEIANERFYYAMFGNLESAHAFMDTLEKMDAQSQKAMLDFVFLGKMTTSSGGVVHHANQQFYNNYAVIRALVQSVAPVYDMTQPPNPESDNSANALFGRMMPSLFSGEGSEMQPTEYGIAFMQAIMAGAMAGDESAIGLSQFFGAMFPPEMMSMLPQPENPPAPRNFLDGIDGLPVDDGGGDDGGSDPDDGTEVCDAYHLTLCVSENECSGAGGYWYNDICNEDASISCDVNNLPSCTTGYDCMQAGGYWYDDTCHTDAQATCSSEQLNLCITSTDCGNAGGYWYDNICNNVPKPVVNLALNASINVSSYYPGYPSSQVNDDNLSTNWVSRFLYYGYSQEEWVQLNLGTVQNFDKIEIEWDNMYFSQNYSIWVWQNNRWTMLKDLTKSSSGPSSINLTPVSSQYILIRMRYGNQYFGISEIKVY